MEVSGWFCNEKYLKEAPLISLQVFFVLQVVTTEGNREWRKLWEY